MNDILPEKYHWCQHTGLIKEHGSTEEFICDCIPVDIKFHKWIWEGTCEEKEGYSFYLQDAAGNIIRDGQAPYKCTKEELVSSKFMNIISKDVIFGVRHGIKDEVRRVFEYCIKMSCKGQTPNQIYRYEFGWNGKEFWWGQRKEIKSGKEYANALRICKLFIGNEIFPTVILAAIHGILEKPLQDAGIRHDFVTYLVGQTGVGKSAILRAVCNYRIKMGNLIAVGSDHKSIKKILENSYDTSIVFDDFCRTKSERVSSSQLQIVSEVIQASSDAVRFFADENSLDAIDRPARHHVVISAEQMINNESTMNRCFPVHIMEPLPEKVFTEIKDMERELVFYDFLISFSKYLGGENYVNVVTKAEANYRSYCQDTNCLGECVKGSDNRINNTYVVQRVIADILMNYFTDLKINPDVLNKVRNNLKSCICAVCRNLKQDIIALHKQESHRTYLEPLAQIVEQMDFGKDRVFARYRLARSEERFVQKNKEPCDAFCIRDGYITFDGKHICGLMERHYGLEGANPKGLSADLQYYALAHVDGEGKVSCRWGTKRRYYHVRVADLLDLIMPDLDDMLREQIISRYKQ